MMNRRGFLSGILAAGMAPAIAKAGVLMPVKQIIVPEELVWIDAGDSWAHKFFDVVTYTGNGTTQSIAHSLGRAPSMLVVKRTDDSTGRVKPKIHRFNGKLYA